MSPCVCRKKKALRLPYYTRHTLEVATGGFSSGELAQPSSQHHVCAAQSTRHSNTPRLTPSRCTANGPSVSDAESHTQRGTEQRFRRGDGIQDVRQRPAWWCSGRLSERSGWRMLGNAVMRPRVLSYQGT